MANFKCDDCGHEYDEPDACPLCERAEEEKKAKGKKEELDYKITLTLRRANLENRGKLLGLMAEIRSGINNTGVNNVAAVNFFLNKLLEQTAGVTFGLSDFEQGRDR